MKTKHGPYWTYPGWCRFLDDLVDSTVILVAVWHLWGSRAVAWAGLVMSLLSIVAKVYRSSGPSGEEEAPR